jgi:DNA replication and repair protein RecF
VRFRHLRVHGLRCLADVSLELGEGLHVFVGDNGAGKTSLLEAVYLLSHARSFRSGAREALLTRGGHALSVFAELAHADDRNTRLGLGREGARWVARVDGEASTLGRLIRECAVICFEPGSHALIAGAAEERRRFLDWGVFHVEHDFLPAWQRYQRALKQRNSLLRAENMPSDSLFEPWEWEMAQAGEWLHAQRKRYLDRLVPFLGASAAHLLPELGPISLRYRPGWNDDVALADELKTLRGRDRGRGHTTAGIHRADWSVAFEQAPLREHLSRGQEKLTALACLLAQASLYAEQGGEWPVICLDDLASELDQGHQEALVAHLAAVEAQVLVTGTEVPAALNSRQARVFHVEQGRVSALL